MAGVMELGFGKLWDKVKAIWAAIATWTNNFFGLADQVEASVQKIVNDAEALIQNTETEIDHWKNFEVDIHWKTRVIHVPTAIEKTREWLQVGPKALIEEVKTLVSNLKAAYKALQTHHRLETATGQSSALQTSIDWMTELREGLLTIDNFILSLQKVIDSVAAIRKEIETLDSIFLQQGNPRIQQTKTVSHRTRFLTTGE
jgi:hypothetical protein